MNFLGKILLAFALFSGVFLTVAQQPVFALSTCNLTLNSSGSDSLFSVPTEQITVSSADVRNDGQSVTSSDGTYFLEISTGGAGGKAVVLPSISGGEFGPIDITAAYVEWLGPASGAQNLEIRVVKNNIPGSAVNREISCRASFRAEIIEAPKPFSCGTPQAGLTRVGTEVVNVAISMSGSGVAPGRSWYAYWRKAQEVGAFGKAPLNPDGGAFTGGASERFGPGTYTLVISNQNVSNAGDLRGLAPSDHQGCVGGFVIPDPITSLPEDDTPPLSRP